MKQSILVTGGAGFIGSNFIPYFLEKYSGYSIVNLDKLTYAGTLANLNTLPQGSFEFIHGDICDENLVRTLINLQNLDEVKGSPRYKFIHGDICDRALVEKVFLENGIQGVIHFAAESHVDNSLADPGEFIKTNVTGTFTVIDVARKSWAGKPNRFHHISTDEVFGSLGPTGLFTEVTSYAPNSPYSASKASSDMIVRSYHHSYGMNVVTTNCSNNYGPKQHNEKFIPTIIRKALAGEKIPVYGDGKNIRDWLYVEDHCTGIDLVFHEGKSGEIYNIGGRNERVNIDIVKQVCSILDIEIPRSDKRPYSELIAYVTDRAGHDFRYAIDATKIENQLGWKANEVFESGIKKTVKWYLEKERS